jgi:hypothetical protein
MSTSLRSVLGTLLLSLSLGPIAALAEAPAPADAPADRLVLAPLNLGVAVAPELEAGVEPVWQALLDHVEAQPMRAASLQQESAQGLWAQTVASLEETETGDLYAVYGRFARTLAEHFEFRTLVMPVLVTRVASLRGEHAHWDGVRRRADMPSDLDLDQSALMSLGFLDTRMRIRGELGAASLHVVVLDADGNVLHEGKGGLDLLHELQRRGSRFETALRDDAFSDPKQLREGVEQALSAAVPAAPAP